MLLLLCQFDVHMQFACTGVLLASPEHDAQRGFAAAKIRVASAVLLKAVVL